jgi:hypothetical protein
LGKLGRRRKWGISFLVKTKRKILRKTGSNKKKKKRQKRREKTKKDDRSSGRQEAREEKKKRKKKKSGNYSIFSSKLPKITRPSSELWPIAVV